MTITHPYSPLAKDEEADREEARSFQRQFFGSMIAGGLACLAIVVVAVITGIKFGLI